MTCEMCGGDLIPLGGNVYRCRNCGFTGVQIPGASDIVSEVDYTAIEQRVTATEVKEQMTYYKCKCCGAKHTRDRMEVHGQDCILPDGRRTYKGWFTCKDKDACRSQLMWQRDINLNAAKVNKSCAERLTEELKTMREVRDGQRIKYDRLKVEKRKVDKDLELAEGGYQSQLENANHYREEAKSEHRRCGLLQQAYNARVDEHKELVDGIARDRMTLRAISLKFGELRGYGLVRSVDLLKEAYNRQRKELDDQANTIKVSEKNVELWKGLCGYWSELVRK